MNRMEDVEVTGRRTAVDFAQQMKWLADEAYPDATVIPGPDNLNTHKPGSLYEAFAPSEARRIAKRLELTRKLAWLKSSSASADSVCAGSAIAC